MQLGECPQLSILSSQLRTKMVLIEDNMQDIDIMPIPNPFVGDDEDGRYEQLFRLTIHDSVHQGDEEDVTIYAYYDKEQNEVILEVGGHYGVTPTVSTFGALLRRYIPAHRPFRIREFEWTDDDHHANLPPLPDREDVDEILAMHFGDVLQDRVAVVMYVDILNQQPVA